VQTNEQTNLQLLHSFTPFGGTAVTAIDCACALSGGSAWLVALGAEDGSLSVWTVSSESPSSSSTTAGEDNTDSRFARALVGAQDLFAHGMQVRRLRFNRHSEPDHAAQSSATLSRACNNKLMLASAAEDHTVRIFEVIQG
jgi:WD40 repeat protein